MDTTTTPAGTHARSSRGKDQIHWGEEVWKALDHAVVHEMMRTRVAAKFLPHVHVDKKQTNVASDVVIVPQAGVGIDTTLSIDESDTRRIQEYSVQFKLTPAQTETEAHHDTAVSHHMAASPPHEGTAVGQPQEHGAMSHSHMNPGYHHRASTGVSLALRSANVLAQAEDLVLFNGQNAVVNNPLFTNKVVQVLDPNLAVNLDFGLLNVDPSGDIKLPAAQVIYVKPVVPAVPGSPPQYREATLNAVASAFSILQGAGHYEHYALVLNTIPYADLHQALPSTLIEPIEPISHLIKAGIYGTATLPPFNSANTGLPKTIGGQPLPVPVANVAYTGVVVSLSGNAMDHVRGRMEDHLDVVVTYNQKDVSENYRFRVVQRFALRLKDPTAVILLVFLSQ